jgi:hypothetical protein
MKLLDLFESGLLVEGGNVSIGDIRAHRIDTRKRSKIIPILDRALRDINNNFRKFSGMPLWSPSLLASHEFLSGSAFHFFDRVNIPDPELVRVKPTVGDIDTQVNKQHKDLIGDWLSSLARGTKVGAATFVFYKPSGEQYITLWTFPQITMTDPQTGEQVPTNIQIDLELKTFSKGVPTTWSKFSQSSSWQDLSAGLKGVFHKYLIQSMAKLSEKEFLLRKMVGRGKNQQQQDVPTKDNMYSFAVSSKEGGGLRAKYEPVLDQHGQPVIRQGLPVMTARGTQDYDQSLDSIFAKLLGKHMTAAQLKTVANKFWSFVGLCEIIRQFVPPEDQNKIVEGFIDKLYAPQAQGLYINDAQRDAQEKDVALDRMFEILHMQPPPSLSQMRQDYIANYKVKQLPQHVSESDVVAKKRKGMPHLRDLKPADFLDLVEELRSHDGRFRLENITLNVKIDGFGGRFGKNAQGKPFMATSRSDPQYHAGFLEYHRDKGTTDPQVLARAAKFDQLFDHMIKAVRVVDQQLGPQFLNNAQVICEVLYLPFATQTSEGKLKFVGIEYDQLPPGVSLVLVPYTMVNASSGEPLANADEQAQRLADLGQHGDIMFMSNRLVQREGLDVTEIINPLENLDQLKKLVQQTHGKRDKDSITLRHQIEAKLKPVQLALEQAIDQDPNIVGKTKMGQDYEGIVINSRLGPIKVTSQKQQDIIKYKAAERAASQTKLRHHNKVAVVAVGSFVGHKGHQQLWDLTKARARELGGDAYLFVGSALGKDDPIPPSIKVQTWHKLDPQHAKNISTVRQGGTLLQKIKHELINPMPGHAPRYDTIEIMVGKDRATMAAQMASALMKAVNKFEGYQHVRVLPHVTEREASQGGTGMSFTQLRNKLRDPSLSQQQKLDYWCKGFDEKKLGRDWILHLMKIAEENMGLTAQLQEQSQHPHGTIVKFRMSPTSAQQLHEWCNQRNIKCLDPQHIHCTVLFSDTPVPHLMSMSGNRVRVPCKATQWQVLGEGALVLVLDNPLIAKFHQHCRNQGGSHKWPQFIPHSTVNYNWQGAPPRQLPDCDLVFDTIDVGPIDPNYKVNK